MIAARQSVSASMRTGTGCLVITAIALIHVGDRWRPTGSVLSPRTITAIAVPSSSSTTPSGSVPCSWSTVPGGVVVGLGDRGPFRQLGVVEVVEQVDAGADRRR